MCGVAICTEVNCELMYSCSPIMGSGMKPVCVDYATGTHPSMALECRCSTTVMGRVDEISFGVIFARLCVAMPF